MISNMKKMTIWAICVALCAVCCMGCNQKNVPESTGGETLAPSASAEATDSVQETQDAAMPTGQTNENINVTVPEESQLPENETTAPVGGNESDQQGDQKPQISLEGKPTYEDYNAMSAEEQQAFYLSFSDPQDFFDWYNAAKEAHDKNSGNVVLGEDGVIDLGDLFGGNEG